MRDLKEASGSLISTPVPTVVIVATLGLAIGANTAIFSVVNGVLLRSLRYADEAELVVLWETHRQRGIDKSQTAGGALLRRSGPDRRTVADADGGGT